MTGNATDTIAIINPASAAGATEKRWTRIEPRLVAALGPIEVMRTSHPGHATVLARQAIARGAARVIAVGGDGTIGEVANGFVADGVPLKTDTALGILDCGTGGDFRHNLGLPKEIDGQIAAIAGGRTRALTLGHARYTDFDGKPAARAFVVICAFGISSDIDNAVNDLSGLKALGGGPAFAIGAIKTLFTYKPKRVALDLGDGRSWSGATLVTAICNGPHTGGGMRMAPDASPWSPSLDAIIAGDLGLLASLAAMPRIYRGTHLSLDRVDRYAVTKLEARPQVPGEMILLDMDGDCVGTLPATIRALPEALKVYVP